MNKATRAKNGICLAQTKAESEPCQNKDQECRLHCGSPKQGKPEEYCARTPMKGKVRCSRHGGKSLGGMAAPPFKDGTRSKYILGRLQSTYTELLNDPKMLELDHEIAVARTYAQEMMNAGGSLRAWEEIDKLYSKWQNAERRNDRMKAREYKQEFEDLIHQGSRQWRNFEQVLSTFERLRKLIDSQYKHMMDNHYAMTLEEYAAQLAKVMDHIVRQMKDREERDALITSLQETLGATPDPGSHNGASRN